MIYANLMELLPRCVLIITPGLTVCMLHTFSQQVLVFWFLIFDIQLSSFFYDEVLRETLYFPLSGASFQGGQTVDDVGALFSGGSMNIFTKKALCIV